MHSTTTMLKTSYYYYCFCFLQ